METLLSVPVTVLMSVYNTEARWLRTAIDSILNQSLTEFEFIIIDDKSTDGSLEILKEYARKDKRIRLVENQYNLGLTKSLNKGLAMAHGRYIARMDADDISLPDRLKKQYTYMEEHTEITVSGGYLYTGKSGSLMLTGYNEDEEILKIQMLFHNAGVPHPTAMIRHNFLKKYGITYDENIRKSQDYALWSSILACGGKIYLMPEVLLKYRIHTGQISADRRSQMRNAREVVRKNLKVLLSEFSEEELKLHCEMLDGIPEREKDAYIKYLKRLKEANEKKKLYDKKKFKYQLNAAWLRLCYHRLRYAKKIDFIFNLLTLKSVSPTTIYTYYITYIKPKRSCRKILRKSEDLFVNGGAF